MYNGIGLVTARGSGTNGFVQRNLSFVPVNKNKPKFRTEEELQKLDKDLQKTPNLEILEHERKRAMEVKCLELEDVLTEEGYSEAVVNEKVTQFREMLMERDRRMRDRLVTDVAKGNIKETHALAAAQQQKNARLKEAFGISEYFVEGSSLDPDRKAKEEVARRLNEEPPKRYDLVRTPSPERSSSPSSKKEKKDKKKKKSKRHRDRSSSRESPKRKKSKKSKRSRSHSPKKKKSKDKKKEKNRKKRSHKSYSREKERSRSKTPASLKHKESDSKRSSAESKVKSSYKKKRDKYRRRDSYSSDCSSKRHVSSSDEKKHSDYGSKKRKDYEEDKKSKKDKCDLPSKKIKLSPNTSDESPRGKLKSTIEKSPYNNTDCTVDSSPKCTFANQLILSEKTSKSNNITTNVEKEDELYFRKTNAFSDINMPHNSSSSPNKNDRISEKFDLSPNAEVSSKISPKADNSLKPQSPSEIYSYSANSNNENTAVDATNSSHLLNSPKICLANSSPSSKISLSFSDTSIVSEHLSNKELKTKTTMTVHTDIEPGSSSVSTSIEDSFIKLPLSSISTIDSNLVFSSTSTPIHCSVADTTPVISSSFIPPVNLFSPVSSISSITTPNYSTLPSKLLKKFPSSSPPIYNEKQTTTSPMRKQSSKLVVSPFKIARINERPSLMTSGLTNSLQAKTQSNDKDKLSKPSTMFPKEKATDTESPNDTKENDRGRKNSAHSERSSSSSRSRSRSYSRSRSRSFTRSRSASSMSLASKGSSKSGYRSMSISKSRSRSRSRSYSRSNSRHSSRSNSRSRSRSRSSRSGSRYSRSRSRSSFSRSRSRSVGEKSTKSRDKSRSPSIPRRKGSPSFLDKRRITSARKRPIPYYRPSPPPSPSSSESSFWSRSLSRSRSRSWSRSPSYSH